MSVPRVVPVTAHSVSSCQRTCEKLIIGTEPGKDHTIRYYTRTTKIDRL